MSHSPSSGIDPSGNANQYEDVVELYGSSVSSCGYCGSETNGRRTFDMKAYKLTVGAYQQLIDRGWRRSGNYLYLPYNKHSCCPNYTISCEATKLELTRSQIKCIDRMNSFLVNGSAKERVHLNRQTAKNLANKEPMSTKWARDIKYIKDNFDEIRQSAKARDRRFVASCDRMMRLHTIDLEEAVQTMRDKSRNRRGKCELPLEEHLYPSRKHLEPSFLLTLKPKRRLQVHLLHVDSEECIRWRDEEHNLIVKYQEAVHGEKSDEWTKSRFENFLVSSPLKTEPMEDRDYTSPASDVATSDSLSVDVSSGQVEQFALVRPPQLPTHFGTYHCLYLLDGDLIAVGVIDFLPKCLTTVYFFYDPKYSSLNLGIYSALVEISIVRQMFKHYRGPADRNDLKYYYLGFYVHQSKKMHYKTSFKPSHLLCPETLNYVPAEDCLAILRQHKYARFDTNGPLESTLVPFFQVPVSVPVLKDSTKVLDYIDWLKSNASITDAVLLVDRFLAHYAEAVGPHLSSRILVKLDLIHKALTDRHRRSVA